MAFRGHQMIRESKWINEKTFMSAPTKACADFLQIHQISSSFHFCLRHFCQNFLPFDSGTDGAHLLRKGSQHPSPPRLMDSGQCGDVGFEQEGMMCAQHCLNMLLQRHLFTATDLADIARTIDQVTYPPLSSMPRRPMQREGALLERPRSPGKSENYDDSGFFSLQVASALPSLTCLALRPRSRSSKRPSPPSSSPSRPGTPPMPPPFATTPRWIGCSRAFGDDVMPSAGASPPTSSTTSSTGSS